MPALDFDLSAFDIFGLSFGAAVVLPDEEERRARIGVARARSSRA
ncbi:hypothetical protein [Eggerthella lenta]|nr:hypothetical protein [Eggerthella lenta]